MSKKIKLPIFQIRGSFIVPGIKENLEVGRKNTLASVNYAIKNSNNQMIAIPQIDASVEKPEFSDLHEFGILIDFEVIKEWKDNSLTISTNPIQRCKVISFFENEDQVPYAEVELIESINDFSDEELKELIEKISDAIKTKASLVTKQIKQLISGESDDLSLAFDSIMFKLAPSKILTNPEYITSPSLKTRWSIIEKIIFAEDGIITRNAESIDAARQKNEIEQELNHKLKEKMDKQQKEYYLREKMRIIKDELEDEDDSDDSSLEKYKERLAKEPFPEEVKRKIMASIKRVEALQSGTPEWNTEKNYIDWMMSIPWWEETEDLTDLKYAKKILDKHHYGMKKVKERIIEYLAVKTKTKSLKAPIITLVGPPGVGKTSLAKSIAEAVGKNFVKVSLGGVKDESEIRGHRKTYVGSMPGRIIQTMKRAKVKNPLFLLDEIDKMASDHRGDPASAMLEVLDPEQNKEFSDHYIEEPYDLSQVMFIATANYPEDIPEALYDRMEIINLSSYTEIEKVKIAQDYLVPKAIEQHELTSEEISFTEGAINEIIKYYTREAGVRQLERHINSIIRKYIVKNLNGEMDKIVIDEKQVNDLLGKRIFDHTEKQEESQIGVVTGLAYTQFGGDILPIEVSLYPGKGNLILTGKLGEVMKESATIALTYVKSNFEKFGVDKKVFEENDIHVHVPEGAVPKDGPSAGITITTALISALSDKPVSKEIGMTGEITLRGNVLPIGGLREKSISASRSGLKTIIIPKKNERDLDEIPDEVKAKLKIIPAEKYEEVFAIVFKTK
ncbi:class III heat shock DNA-binding ATP dependent Lon protease [Mesoplasma florum L1]|uniref:Lon protease n=1 Tax=Mesoplasma florum (strain ATCC 33453 / NBRC 100688 / NCTC 11704 / L1) TaxID=265311 RepID=Q6F160_MESFL|nr:endopeptidase La [Mesoplasma florum]AIU94520.1 mf-lon [Cloning vector pECL275]AIU94531.1 mf-lon [Cloning vector pECGMC3]ALP32215.1 protease [Cloning vector pDM2L]WIW78221.1 endopeptidase La [synthetic construct]WKD80958.1 mf-lon [Vector pGE_curli_3R-Xlon]